MGGASLETKRQREHEVRSLPTRSMLRVLRALSPVLCPAGLAVDQQERGNSRITPSQPKTEVQKIFKKINKCSWNTVSGTVTPIRSKEKPKLSTLKAYLITSWIILNFLINDFFFLNRECRLIKPENKTRNAEQGRSKCPTAETMA